MRYKVFSHRHGDIIINCDYSIKKEIDIILDEISCLEISKFHDMFNQERIDRGKKEAKGMQPSLKRLLDNKFENLEWKINEVVFSDQDNNLIVDYYKRKIGIDVSFKHASSTGSDLLKLQAAGDIQKSINKAIIICGTREFNGYISPSDASSMVNFDKFKWYLETFYSVINIPILLIGLDLD